MDGAAPDNGGMPIARATLLVLGLCTILATPISHARMLTLDPDVGLFATTNFVDTDGATTDGTGDLSVASGAGPATVTTMGDTFAATAGTFNFGVALSEFIVDGARTGAALGAGNFANRFEAIVTGAALTSGSGATPIPTGVLQGEIVDLIIAGSGAATTYEFDARLTGGSGSLFDDVFAGVTDVVIVYNVGSTFFNDGALTSLDASFQAFGTTIDITTAVSAPAPALLLGLVCLLVAARRGRGVKGTVNA